jgi:CubicO group peptidase (beta-lactamase class C family)
MEITMHFVTVLRPALIGLLLLAHAAVSAAPYRGVGEPQQDVDALFATWDAPDSAGCALGVYRDGAIVYSRGYGMADLERAVPITPRSLFDLGSTSKQFTAASIVLLAEQGKLTLDDDVRLHLPEMPDYGTPITLRQLLNHTSGLRDYITLMTLHGSDIDDVTTPADALAMVVRQKQPNFQPGSEHLYSNTGYFLLSLVAERTSGSSLRDFTAAKIFKPLGMDRSFVLGRYDDVVEGRALAYSTRPDGSLRTDVSRWMQLGDGAVFSTVEELLQWDNQFHEPRIGGADLTEQLQTPGRLADGTVLDYGLGLVIEDYRGLRSVHHGGAWGGYRAQLMRFPEQRFTVALLCNLGEIDTSALARKVADVFLEAELESVPDDVEASPGTASAPVQGTQPSQAAELPRAALAALAGNWRDPETRVVRVFAMDGDTLHLINPSARYAVRPRSDGDLELIDAPAAITLRLEAAVADAPRRMHWMRAGSEGSLLEQLPVVTFAPAELARFAGVYYSDEIDARQRIEASAKGIIMHGPRAEPQALPLVAADEFASGATALRFQRDSQGAVTGYEMDVGRVRGLVFSRQVDGDDVP